MNVTPYDESRALFIRRWGEMGASWGISRTMAEIHALLFISNVPLCADQLMAELQVSRGNASMNLRQLVAWGLIQRVHRRGDRKEYFEAETDVWQMFETIVRERRRREVQPIVETLQRCLAMIDEERTSQSHSARKEAEVFRKRFVDILEFYNLMNSVFDLVSKAGLTGIKPLVKTLGKLGKLAS